MITEDKQIDKFTDVRVSGWDLKVNDRFLSDLTGELHDKYVLDNVRGPFEEINASKFARTYKCSVGFSGRSETVYIKHYLYRSWIDFVKHLFRKGRAQRAFDASLMLQKNSLEPPRIVAFGKFGIGPLTLKSFLITQEIEDSRPVHEYLNELWDDSDHDSLSGRHDFITALGSKIGQMHSLGIFHGDLRLGNVFARKVDGKWKFFFLDNERTRKFNKLPNKLVIKNLVQVNMFRTNISDSDRTIFLTAYLAECPAGEHEKQLLISKVLAKTKKRLDGISSKAI